MSTPYIFHCEIIEAYSFKILIDLLTSNLSFCHFKISKDGIFLIQSDDENSNKTGKKAFSISLFKEKFTIFEFNKNEHFSFSVSSHPLARIIKTIKRKDTIELKINNDEKTIEIIIDHQNQTRKHISSINIQPTQYIEYDDLNIEYDHMVIDKTLEFGNSCKDLQNMSPIIEIECFRNSIKFKSKSPDEIYSQTIILGKNMNMNEKPIFSKKYNSEIILNLAKCRGLTTQFAVHSKIDYPICFEFNVGVIGILKIFIHSCEE